MVDAAAAGVMPLDFYQMTFGEIIVAIEGFHERERQSLISRVNAVVRGLSTLGKKGTDPFRGLKRVTRESVDSPTSLSKIAADWLWK